MGRDGGCSTISTSVRVAVRDLTIAWFAICRVSMTVLFQNGTLELRSASKATEAVELSEIWFRSNLVDSIERAVLTARVSGVTPLICTMTPTTGGCGHGVVGLLITMCWIYAMVTVLGVRSSIRVDTRDISIAPHHIVLALPLTHIWVSIAIRPRRIVAIAIWTPVSILTWWIIAVAVTYVTYESARTLVSSLCAISSGTRGLRSSKKQNAKSRPMFG